MRIISISFCLMAILSFSLAGCGADASKSSSDGSGDASSAADGHDDHDGHDHSDDDGHDHAAGEHQHPTEGPHGGHLIELGDEEYHAELLHDEATHKVAIHVLDGAGKKAVAIPATEITVQLFQDGKFVKYALKAVQASGGSASQFELVDAALCDALCDGDATKGRLQVTIDGKPYTGVIEHERHEGHDHEGDEHAGHDHG